MLKRSHQRSSRVITNARVVIGDGSEPVEGGTVVVRAGSVVYAGPASGAPAGGGTAVDAKGAYVTPGIFATVTTLGLDDVQLLSNVGLAWQRQHQFFERGVELRMP